MDANKLRELLENESLEPFIRQIRFPQYKSLALFTSIDFTFPITAIVGANGTNKSSVLRALYGAPSHTNLGNFWFSTDTDPIEEGDTFPNCFIYSYKHPKLQKNIEILKTRVERENDPDYWEPSRPIQRYKMEKMPKYEKPNKDIYRVQTRWNPIKKTVKLIDFRHSLSAFDKCFYYGDFSSTDTFKSKKNFIRRRAKHLNRALNNKAESYMFFGKQRVVSKENRILNKEETQFISEILGREYTEIQLIHHDFFNTDGHTARIKLKNLKYTEAFAGSGEFAAIKLVTEICSSPMKSLILLDEPEVSLHPGAQERLLSFLYQQVIRKKLQIVFTTHSPALIRDLPPDAIKVLSVSEQDEVTLVSQSSYPEEAFVQIGEPISGKLIILVEDRLAQELVKMALRRHYPNLLNVIEICYYPGGVSTIFKRYLPLFAAEGREKVICLLDGDQRPENPWPSEVEVRRALDSELDDLIQAHIGDNQVELTIDGGPKERQAQQKSQLQRQFLSWCHQCVRYLPTEACPEQFILEKNQLAGLVPAKSHFEQLTRAELGYLKNEPITSDEIFSTQRRHLAMINEDDEDIKKIANIINDFLNGRGNEVS